MTQLSREIPASGSSSRERFALDQHVEESPALNGASIHFHGSFVCWIKVAVAGYGSPIDASHARVRLERHSVSLPRDIRYDARFVVRG